MTLLRQEGTTSQVQDSSSKLLGCLLLLLLLLLLQMKVQQLVGPTPLRALNQSPDKQS
jgi:hypothetical protein